MKIRLKNSMGEVWECRLWPWKHLRVKIKWWRMVFHPISFWREQIRQNIVANERLRRCKARREWPYGPMYWDRKHESWGCMEGHPSFDEWIETQRSPILLPSLSPQSIATFTLDFLSAKNTYFQRRG